VTAGRPLLQKSFDEVKCRVDWLLDFIYKVNNDIVSQVTQRLVVTEQHGYFVAETKFYCKIRPKTLLQHSPRAQRPVRASRANCTKIATIAKDLVKIVIQCVFTWPYVIFQGARIYIRND